jgi:hypothetical protein
VTSPAPLTEAEAAAARALAGDFECSWHVGCDEECRADMARAVVAAVRGPLLHEAADRMLQHATEAENHDATESAVYTFMVAADRLRDWACHPLSRHNPEENR